MKNRWIGGLALATAMVLGACAPQQGADETDAADPAVESASPSAEVEAAEPSESAEESESAAPTPDDYEY